MLEILKKEIQDSIDVKKKLIESRVELEKILLLIKDCTKALMTGKKIIFCGNGGSFADSQHLTAEFVSRLRFDRNPLAALSLGTNSSNITAVSNDYGYEKVFSRELSALGNKGDIFVPISTSGNSPNIIEAIKQAKKMNLITVGFTGENGGQMSKICKTINVPSKITEKIQESHIMIGHIICAQIEINLFKNNK
jgi:D-sedoheptulose 7-phosphate isomerase